ncbi:Peroxisomal acyl-coenzyme a oxidase 1-like protein [Heracleum sosnowskyi]|uniref:Peroxisomal acyl-coenzyme a oxidase 1-like protein n=1 Tax=Heracleum sosnowskyi TaxID=360622 RepID=A0AAD8MRY8_9APIA|nr:Peroxisomal acyl-coenzyme a oxidase 1-like protein [Heracleum sosnowskyi]
MSVQIGSMEAHNLHPEMPQNLKDYISELNLEAPPLFVAQKLLTATDVMQDRLLFPKSLINAEFSYNFLTEVEKELLEKQHVEVNLVDGMMREYHTLHLAKWDIASCSFYVLRSGWNDVVLQNKLSVTEDLLNPSAILEAFKARAIRMAVSSAQSLGDFPNPEDGFAELSADLTEVAIAHCRLIVVSKFIDKLKQEIHGKGVKQQLVVLYNIYALSLLHKHQGEFLATSSITTELQALLATAQLRNLYSQVRPNAVALVDSFNYTDHYLGSVLGRYDGNVYPKLYEAAWKDPLNDSVVPDGYVEYIKPLLQNNLHLSRL